VLGPAPAPRYSLAMEFVLFSVWALYFLPFAVSAGNEHEHHLPILIFNACAGWTGVGWVVALIWALHPSPQRRRQLGQKSVEWMWPGQVVKVPIAVDTELHPRHRGSKSAGSLATH